MKKKTLKKLALSRETLRVLTVDLEKARGGGASALWTCATCMTCDSCASACAICEVQDTVHPGCIA